MYPTWLNFFTRQDTNPSCQDRSQAVSVLSPIVTKNQHRDGPPYHYLGWLSLIRKCSSFRFVRYPFLRCDVSAVSIGAQRGGEVPGEFAAAGNGHSSPHFSQSRKVTMCCWETVLIIFQIRSQTVAVADLDVTFPTEKIITSVKEEQNEGDEGKLVAVDLVLELERWICIEQFWNMFVFSAELRSFPGYIMKIYTKFEMWENLQKFSRCIHEQLSMFVTL